ncbi:hypothetical protein MIND_00886800 [Mycena indigotica]|uniref:Uncharacterized protein n=1 Tax=Mycena indigotica TaxID=2126181 RepID=A0A8H6SGW7_9AGAR|nr:uncharacterized protein MIND_00886800 [Mycena indigotica]KAF7299375.1 hypothetical protein MIND_00886800 [Mycena indigotica]
MNTPTNIRASRPRNEERQSSYEFRRLLESLSPGQLFHVCPHRRSLSAFEIMRGLRSSSEIYIKALDCGRKRLARDANGVLHFAAPKLPQAELTWIRQATFDNKARMSIIANNLNLPAIADSRHLDLAVFYYFVSEEESSLPVHLTWLWGLLEPLRRVTTKHWASMPARSFSRAQIARENVTRDVLEEMRAKSLSRSQTRRWHPYRTSPVPPPPLDSYTRWRQARYPRHSR